MSDIDESTLSALRDPKRSKKLMIEDQSWGYTIRAGQRASLSVIIGQAIAYVFGIGFGVACLGLLFMPSLLSSSEPGPMSLGAATLFGAGAAYLLWFASRGGRVEVEVDTDARQIREVIQNRAGEPTVISAYAFDDIGGIYLETAAGTAPEQLVMGFRGQMILLAEGETDELGVLRTRLSRDLMGPMEPAIMRRTPSPEQQPMQKSGAAA